VSRSMYWIMWPTVQAMMWGTLLIVYLLSYATMPGSAILANFGKWSYSAYVWHVLLIELLKGKFLWMPSYLFGLLVVLPATLIVSFASYKLIELPFLSLRSSYRPARTHATPPPVTAIWASTDSAASTAGAVSGALPIVDSRDPSRREFSAEDQ
jgi:peptidoglycan/LPS O-acetylase OafA/YrhL